MASWFKIDIKNSVVVPPAGGSYHVANNAMAILKKAHYPVDAQIYSDGKDEADRTFFFSPQAAEILKNDWQDWANYYPKETDTPDLNTLTPVLV
jgi:hypothetical protein